MGKCKVVAKKIAAILLVLTVIGASVSMAMPNSVLADEPEGNESTYVESHTCDRDANNATTTPYLDPIDESGISEMLGSSWTAIITIDTGTNFDIYAWWNQDIIGVYTWDPEHKPVSEIKSVSVQVIAWDVDNPSGTPPPTEYETDLVYLNGQYLGVLVGPDQGWAGTPMGTGGWVTTTFVLTPEQIGAIFGSASYPLTLTCYIDSDSQHSYENWAVAIDKVIITIEYESAGIKITQPNPEETFWIDAEPEPRMPTINCQAIVVGVTPDPTAITEFSWEATLRYSEFGRDDLSRFYGSRIIGGGWTVDFRNTIAGGEMEITATAIVQGVEYKDKVKVFIRGKNPSKARVKEELGSLILQAISYKETWPGHRWLQFHPEGDPRWGLPEHERGVEIGGGWGLMQITWRPTIADVWNWKQNIKSGRQTYIEGESFSRECVTYFKALYPEDKAKIKLSKEQHDEQACHYYNRGRLDGYYWLWDPTAKNWYINPAVPRDPTTGLTYAQDIMRIVSLVNSGTPPPEW